MEAKQVGWGQQGQRSQHPGPRRQLPPPQPLRLVSRSQKYSLGCEVSAALSSRKEFKVFKRPAGEAPRPQQGRGMEPILVSVLAPGPGDDESAKGLSPTAGPLTGTPISISSPRTTLAACPWPWAFPGSHCPWGEVWPWRRASQARQAHTLLATSWPHHATPGCRDCTDGKGV